jgi:putative aminopeptidase FrvX
MNNFDFKKTFLDLTKTNVPHGTEHRILNLLPDGLSRDNVGNYYIMIGESRTMFTSHLDDASWGGMNKVKHVIDGDIIKTDGSTILGADDKAGVTIMIYMIQNNVPGLYYFFIGEESGMIGSKSIVDYSSQWFIDNIDRCISFDRRAYGSVITHQYSGRCCSDEFADELINQYKENGMPHRKDSGGIFTDSAAFMHILPECTNLSVGYFSEHTHMERQDIEYLEKLAIASTKIDWENLPTKRDPSKSDSIYDDYDDYDDFDNYLIM